MSSKTYTVLAILQAKPGKEADLKQALQSLIEPTLKEEGCINYDLHENLHKPGEFLFYENWTSQAAHQKHDQSGHIHRVRNMLGPIAEHVDVTFWGKICP
jgi:quinol monooxygenase YgiN